MLAWRFDGIATKRTVSHRTMSSPLISQTFPSDLMIPLNQFSTYTPWTHQHHLGIKYFDESLLNDRILIVTLTHILRYHRSTPSLPRFLSQISGTRWWRRCSMHDHVAFTMNCGCVHNWLLLTCSKLVRPVAESRRKSRQRGCESSTESVNPDEIISAPTLLITDKLTD